MKKITIPFNQQLAATALFPTPRETAEEMFKALSLPVHKAVLVVVGAAANLAPELVPRLTQLFGHGIAPAAQAAEAVVVDGGTQAGVMALMGAGVASRGHRTALVGVAPATLVAFPGNAAGGTTPLEPNHSHFVLVAGDAWGDETATMFRFVQALLAGPVPAAGHGHPPVPRPAGVPGLMVLAGGGAVAITEVLQAVRLGLPVLVLAGSGGLADRLAGAWQTRDTPPDDPTLAEILANGTLHLYPLSGSSSGLKQLIVRELKAAF